jgi:hypothetical protein
MPRIFYIDSGRLGHPKNNGTHRRSPNSSLASLGALGVKSGDTVLIRYGTAYTEPLLVPYNGVSFGVYMTGSEKDHAPLIRTTGKDSKGISVTGQDNVFEDLDVFDAETGVFVEKGATGNQFRRVRVQEYGYGYLIKGSHTVVVDAYVAYGRMVRNTGAKTDVGASAFTLWRETGFEHRGTRISGALVEQAWADALAFEDGDGSDVEIFNGVEDAVIERLTSLDSKTLVEIGGDRSETVKNIRFVKCHTMGSGGKVMFVNDPAGAFAVDWQGVSIEEGTLIADEYDESPFYFAGHHGDMSARLRIVDSIIVGTSQIFNSKAKDPITGKEIPSNTRLDTIVRENNTYWRTDGSKNVGIPLTPTERFADPDFYNPKGRDYRLKAASKAAAGALWHVASESEQPRLKRLSPSTRVFATAVVGGHRQVDTWHDMTAIDEGLRVAGMTVYVKTHRLTYRLQSDRHTWLKVS